MAVRPKKMTMATRPTTIGKTPRFAGLDVVDDVLGRTHLGGAWPPREQAPGVLADDLDIVLTGLRLPRSPGCRRLRRDTGRDRLDDLLLRRLRALVDAHVPAPPRRAMRVGRLKMSWRLWEMITTAEALFGQSPHECEHLLGLCDPSAAVGSSRRRAWSSTSLRVRRRPTALASGERGHRLPDRADRRHREGLQGRRPCAAPSRAR